MSARIDHFMYAVPSLEEGVAWATETFGVAPAYGGEHVGLGTCNTLLSLGDTYLEIIAPDPRQTLDGTLGERFAALEGGGMVTWAVQGQLADIAAVLADQGVDTSGPNRTERRTAEGDLLVWELLFPTGTAWGARMPFFIDWLECPHPSTTNPPAGELIDLRITTPDAQALSKVLGAIGLTPNVEDGDPSIDVRIATDAGEVTLSSTAGTAQISMR